MAYTVTFLDHDGTVLSTLPVAEGAAATAPEVPDREGYAFTGWDKAFDNVTEDITVTAQYMEICQHKSHGTDGLCTNCGEPVEHTYESGICTGCGASEPVQEVTAILAGTMNEWNTASANMTDAGDSFVSVTMELEAGSHDFKIVYDGSWYVTFNGIAAKEMMDNVYVTIYNADGEAVSDTWTDSVCAQAMRNLAKDTISAEEKTMVVDMLNYGAAAQEEFGYNTACLANALLSEEQKALSTESTAYEDTHIGEGSYVASNLMLKSNIQLMFAFRNVTSDMKAVVTFTNHRGVAKNITIEGSEFTKSGSLSIVTVEDMVVADSRQDITCTIYDGEEVVAAITDSVESYATRKSNTLFEMLMRFSDSAYAYFH